MHNIRHFNIGRIVHRLVLRLCHRIGNDDSITHSIQHFDIGRIVHRLVLRLRFLIGYNDGVVHSIRHFNIGRIMHSHILCLRFLIGYNDGVVHRIRHIDIGRVVHGIRNIDIDSVMHIHRINRRSGQRGFGGRLLFVVDELSAERNPYGVAGMQRMNVHMGDSVIALHPIGFSYRVDRLSTLDNVHIVFASLYHLLLLAHLNRCRTWLLRPCCKACQ